jgi:hypothetical protein
MIEIANKRLDRICGLALIRERNLPKNVSCEKSPKFSPGMRLFF